MSTETILAVLGGYLGGVTTLLTVEWIRNRRHEWRVRRITKAWFEHHGLVEIKHLVRDVGIYTHDPDLLFKANLIHILDQLHPHRAEQPPSGLGLTPVLIEDLEGLRPTWRRFFHKRRRGEEVTTTR